MSVRPVAFDPSGGITVHHDELQHGGTVSLSGVRFGRKVDGTVDTDWISVTCPVCGAISFHPVSGGADAPRIQKLFLRTYLRRAAALGIQATFAAAKARVKARVQAMDGAERWRLESMQSEDEEV